MIFGSQTDDISSENQQTQSGVISPSDAPPSNDQVGAIATADDTSDTDTATVLQQATQDLADQTNTSSTFLENDVEPAKTASTAPPYLADTPSLDGGTSDEHDLLGLKQQALADLSPLVGQLEQTPEEKFRTTMMMIQSTDNQSLIKEAYAAAQAITDDKVKAQALLDVINEINYFTQQKEQQG